jgi:hypothetical protein
MAQSGSNLTQATQLYILVQFAVKWKWNVKQWQLLLASFFLINACHFSAWKHSAIIMDNVVIVSTWCTPKLLKVCTSQNMCAQSSNKKVISHPGLH